MALKLYGNTEIGAQVQNEIGNLICLRHLLIDSGHKSKIYHQKRPGYLHTCASCYELPSNISTIGETVVRFSHIVQGQGRGNVNYNSKQTNRYCMSEKSCPNIISLLKRGRARWTYSMKISVKIGKLKLPYKPKKLHYIRFSGS